MDLKVLDEDKLIEVLSEPQIYTFELWVTSIVIEKGENRNVSVIFEDKKKRKTANNKLTQVKKIEQYFNNEDVLIDPGGFKPLRVHFSVFNLKKTITLSQIDFIRLKKLSKFAIKQLEEEEHVSMFSEAELSAVSDETHDEVSLTTTTKKTTTIEEEIDYEKLSNLIESDFFQPKPTIMNKSGCITFAQAPLKIITEMQRGPIKVIIDKHAGRIDDPGDPVGVTEVPVPKEWYETIVRVATKPLISPTIEKVNGKSVIEEKKLGQIGIMEYTLTLSCYSGFVTSKIMPSSVGLNATLIDSEREVPYCHQPTVRQDVTLTSLRRSDQ